MSRCFLVSAALILAGCAVGPDFEPPPAPDVSGYTAQPLPQQTASADVKGGEAQRLVQNLDISGQWWTLFHSEALTKLVEDAIAHNPSLPAAEAALRQAWENVTCFCGLERGHQRPECGSMAASSRKLAR